jgi:hypothetical protein
MHLSSINERKRPCAMNELRWLTDWKRRDAVSSFVRNESERQSARTHAVSSEDLACGARWRETGNSVSQNVTIASNLYSWTCQFIDTKVRCWRRCCTIQKSQGKTTQNKTKSHKGASSWMIPSFLPSSLCNLTSKNRLKFSREFIHCAT